MIVLHHVKDKSSVTDFWGTVVIMLLESVTKYPISNFLQWKFIKNTMFHPLKKVAFNKLRNSKRWNYFKSSLKEDKFGNPTPYKYYPKSSGNLLHHAYSLNEFLDFSETNFSKLESIYEFGGGYGSLCRLIFRLGFHGVYTIKDLPVICTLQKQYLSNVLDETITDIKNDHYAPSVDLFISLWSLSECPIEGRDKVFESIKFKKCLIAFQKEFDGINNLKYFKSLMKSMPEHHWKLYEIKHLPGNYYLLGEQNA